jgi:hypothetical protein
MPRNFFVVALGAAVMVGSEGSQVETRVLEG